MLIIRIKLINASSKYTKQQILLNDLFCSAVTITIIGGQDAADLVPVITIVDLVIAITIDVTVLVIVLHLIPQLTHVDPIDNVLEGLCF